jgi:hypothetical protein
MNINLLKSMLGILVIGIAGYAHATTLTNTNPGPTLNPGDFATFGNSSTVDGYTFNDDWFFVLASTGAGGVVTNEPVSVSTTNLVNISGLSLSLWTESGGTKITEIASGGTDFNLPLLVPGSYELVITGTATGALGGAYSGVVATPVPLPAAAWLLLSGLAGVGAMARRRRTG